MFVETNQTFDILTLGEALVDMISIERGATLDDVDTFKRYLGGAPVNVAATAVRLNRRAAVMARVGGDTFGRFIRAELRRLDVPDLYLQTDPLLPTTLAFVASTTGSPDFQIVRGADAQLAIVSEDADDELASLDQALASARALHVSMFALSVEPCRSTAVRAIHLAHEHGLVVSLDPNYRLGIWHDESVLHDLLRELAPLTTLMKPSLDDGHAIFGPDLAPAEIIAHFHDYGARQVVLTLGKDGVVVSDGATQRALLAEPIEVADATGAGDAFTAGAILALVDGLDLKTAARIGQKVAAAKLRGVGHGAVLPNWAAIREAAES